VKLLRNITQNSVRKANFGDGTPGLHNFRRNDNHYGIKVAWRFFLNHFVQSGLPIKLQSSKSPHQSVATSSENKEEHRVPERRVSFVHTILSFGSNTDNGKI
jgi:hypothetical protein